MSKSLGLLLTKAANCVGSQAKLAQTMNQPTTVISDWKCGRRAISSERIAELARVAGEDEGKWIALITVEKTGHEGAKRWIQQLAGAALTIVLLAPIAIQSVHYVKFLLNRFLQILAKYRHANCTKTTTTLLIAC